MSVRTFLVLLHILNHPSTRRKSLPFNHPFSE